MDHENNNLNDDFHFDDIDEFCREDIHTLIEKSDDVEFFDFDCDENNKAENFDDEQNNDDDIEFIEFNDEGIINDTSDLEKTEVFDFDLDDADYLNVANEDIDDDIDFEEPDIDCLEMDFEDITDAVDYAFTTVIQEPEVFDFALEEIKEPEILDDSFFNVEVLDDIFIEDNSLETLKDKKKNVKKLLVGILIIMLIMLGFVIYKVVKWYLDNESIKKQVNDIYSKVIVEEVTDNTNTVIVDNNNQNEENNNPEEPFSYSDIDKYTSLALINVDFNQLKEINPDTVAWLQVNGTNINYPVVQTSDNSYYLKHSFNKSYNEAGWIFADYRNNLIDDRNLIIYGHARLNETMFGSLKNTIKSNWYSNSNNYVIKLSTPNINSSWQVFSTYTIPAEDYYITTNFADDTSFYEFEKILMARSVYNYNVELSPTDRIITLSTCYSDNKRVVLHAKLIKYENR